VKIYIRRGEDSIIMEHSAGGVIYYRGEGGIPMYLVLLSRRGIWEFPKGHIENKEDPQGAALREINEETGLSTIKLMGNFKYVISYAFYKDGERIKKDVVYFIAETKKAEVKISNEHTGFMWLGFNEAFQRLTHAQSKKLITEANAWINALDGVWRA
jgi:8-oxo-dGTP pyrophosphatase MutT (NUDIX family)